jgi:hypothetical protein
MLVASTRNPAATSPHQRPPRVAPLSRIVVTSTRSVRPRGAADLRYRAAARPSLKRNRVVGQLGPRLIPRSTGLPAVPASGARVAGTPTAVTSRGVSWVSKKCWTWRSK